MDVRFDDEDLARLEVDPKAGADRPQGVVKAFRRVVQFLRSAQDERDLRQWKAWRFERLKGDRAGQCSLRLNDQWRLVIRLSASGSQQTVHIIEVVDYHRG